jgi:flagellar biosynthesis chaperone FliJ
MKQLASSYDKKIKELHSLVEQKARELQAVSERVEVEKKRENEVKEHIVKLINDSIKLEQKILNQIELIKSDRSKWQKEGIEHDKKLFEARNILSSLMGESLELKKQNSRLGKISSEKSKLDKKVNSLNKVVENLEGQVGKLSKKIEISELELQDNQSKKADLQKLAGRIMEEILETHKNTQEYRNHIYFYIRRIVQNYEERGKKAPDVFDRFKVNVPIRADILKKLKQEQLRPKRYE